MKLSNESIKEIAQNLDCGMVCYINTKTFEIKSIIDPNDMFAEEELWKADLEEIENDGESYLKIEKMPSREAFRIMEDFADQVTNKKIRNRLIYALEMSKPFKHFKYEVDCNEDIRQQWFKFKEYRYEEWVKDYCEMSLEDDGDKNFGPPIPISGGYYYDDGSEFNPDLFPLPQLCISCKNKDDPYEEILCNLTRMDQNGEPEFKCFAYQRIGEK
ncbi:MAG: UPF0158 family protein [Saprospiraceae bacterium]